MEHWLLPTQEEVGGKQTRCPDGRAGLNQSGTRVLLRLVSLEGIRCCLDGMRSSLLVGCFVSHWCYINRVRL
jgi:hypothetical protein